MPLLSAQALCLALPDRAAQPLFGSSKVEILNDVDLE
jgi:hypothetical protein